MFDVISIGGATQDIYLDKASQRLVSPWLKNAKNLANIKNLNKLLDSQSGQKIELENAIFETGGGGTNSAVTFSKMGLKSAFLGKIGKDAPAEAILKILKKENINTGLVIQDPKTITAFSIIMLNKNGEKTILIYRGAEEDLKIRDIKLNKLKTKWLYITSLAGNLDLAKKIINYAYAKKIKIAFNPGAKELEQKGKLFKILENIDVLILNLEEARDLAKESKLSKIYSKLSLFGKIQVVTLGAKGATACQNNQIYFIPITHYKNTVDTTGAGDAFGSAFISGLIIKNDIEFALRLGISNARNVITKIGAKNGLLNKLPKKLNYKIRVTGL